MKRAGAFVFAVLAALCGCRPAFAATTYTYDALGRLTTVAYGDGTAITFAYDAAGNRTSKGAVTTPNIKPVSGTPQVATVGTAFALPLRVRVADGTGSGTSGAAVTFTVPGSGASANCSAPAPTDANGTTQTTCTANATAGSYVVTASVAGIALPASFALTNYGGASGTPTAIGASMNPAIYTGSITLTVTITGSSPTGTVNFLDGGVSIPGCEARPVVNGIATCTTTALLLGNNNLTAIYSGDGGNAPGSSAILTLAAFTALDADANGQSDALTDGLLIIRRLFGLSGSPLINGAVGAGAIRNTAPLIETFVSNAGLLLDVDGNGQVDALTDGLIIIRYLFGLRGNPLINGAIGTGATRTTPTAVETYLGNLLQ